MPEQLVICAENLLNTVQFPSHVLTASSEASSYTVDRLANNRRHAGDRFESSSTNADINITVSCNQVRGADFWAIDRASNHKGYRYQLLNNADNFASSGRTVKDINTIPLVVGGLAAGATGCVTDEGAWWQLFDAEANHYWRVTSKAMGSGLKPQITGLWIGKAWQPTEYLLRFPLEDRAFDFTHDVEVSPYGWAGKGQVARPRVGTLRLGFPSEADEDLYAYHIESLAMRGFPFWLCWQKTAAPWRALLVRLLEGSRPSAPRDPSWHTQLRSVDLAFVEVEPA